MSRDGLGSPERRPYRSRLLWPGPLSEKASLAQKGRDIVTTRLPPRPWTAQEQKQLDELLEAGKTVVEIAAVLQRTRLAIYARLQRRYRKRSKPTARWPKAI
jgi:hypothetical protein